MRLTLPLEWPSATPRKPRRKTGQFRAEGQEISTRAAVARLEKELSRHEAANVELSAQFDVTRAGNVSPQWAGGDPGCCLRLDIARRAFVLPCDTYTDLAQNIAAIAAHLESVRNQERYGVATTSESLSAFAALPPPSPWWRILGVAEDAPDQVIRSVYRTLAAKHHPDVPGGNEQTMARYNAAMTEARKRRPGL